MSEAAYRIERARRTGARTLDLSECGLYFLPDSLTELTSLTSLDVRDNHLTSLPEWLGDLRLDHNRIDVLPERLGELTALTPLDSGGGEGNQLTDIPESLGSLTALPYWACTTTS